MSFAAATLEGCIDAVDLAKRLIKGWAWDRRQPEAPVPVDVWVGDTLLDTIVADDFREDLLAAGKGTGRHGFTYCLPSHLTSILPLHVRFAGTKRELQSSPRFLVDTSPEGDEARVNDLYAGPRNITSLEECCFYHTMDIPGYGHVEGVCDLRHTIREYLGGANFNGKRALDVGKASGFLTFHMEGQGAEVVAYDLSENEDWDSVPYAGTDYQELVHARKSLIWHLNNGFWLAHKAFNSKSKLVCGTVYAIPKEIGLVDTVVLGSILIHLRDPFYALQNALRLARETVIVADIMPVSSPEGIRGPYAHFLPDAVACNPKDTWWKLSPELVRRFIGVLGLNQAKS